MSDFRLYWVRIQITMRHALGTQRHGVSFDYVAINNLILKSSFCRSILGFLLPIWGGYVL